HPQPLSANCLSFYLTHLTPHDTRPNLHLPSFPTRRSSDLDDCWQAGRDEQGRIVPNRNFGDMKALADYVHSKGLKFGIYSSPGRSEEHTSELQSPYDLVCRLLLEKKKR